MKQITKRQKAFELFENGWDCEEVADQLQMELEDVEEWAEEYNLEAEIEQLDGDPDTLNGLLEAIKERNSIKREELDLYRKEKENEEAKQKRSKVIYFKKLFTFFKNHCQGYKWKYDEVILLIKKFKTLQLQIEEITGHDQEVFEILFIWDRTRILIDHLEELVKKNEAGDEIKFKFDENDLLFLEESLEIEDFDEEIEVETEEEQALNGLLEEEFSPRRL